jgi:hypothetical protein
VNEIVLGGLIFAAFVGGMAAWYFRQNKKTSTGSGAGGPSKPPVKTE